jgi:long-chain acyl-CoA synthetase
MGSVAFKNPVPAEMPWLKNYPEGINWDLQVPSVPLFSFLEQTIAKYGERDALHFAGHIYTYGVLGKLVDRAAAGLQILGVKKGVKVGLFMPNSVYSVVMYYAILKSGGTVVNYNPVYAERDLIAQAEDSETDILVTLDVPAILDKATALLDQTRINKIILCPFKQNMTATTKTLDLPGDPSSFVWFCDLIANSGNPAPFSIDFEKDIAVLQYTGGTTGTPKAAVLTHRNVVANALQIGAWYHNAEDGKDSMIAVLPLFHVFAMTVIMNMSLMRGLKLFIMPQFDIKDMLHLIQSEKPSYLCGVPTIFMALASYDRIGEYDFSSLKFCLSGGAPLPNEVKAAFEKKTGAKLLTEGYGLTEASPVVTCNPLSAKARSGSIGLPVPGTVVEIISAEDGVTVLPVGEKGEVCARGPQVMQGYYKKPEETAKVLRNGRLHTGDIGYMDEDGFIYIVDRIKDLILVSGYNVYPRHVEEAIYSHPAVKECIVAGVPDKLRGEVPYAWVKPIDGNPLDADTLRAFLKDKLSPTEMPKRIIIREEPLPKTAVGKLSKKDLLAQEGYSKMV